MQAVSVRTYLRRGKELVQMEDIGPDWVVPRSIEGAIDLRVWDQPVLTVAEWDEVDYFWMFILKLVRELLDGADSVETRLPDQSGIRLRFSTVTKDLIAVVVEVGTERRRAVAGRRELLRTLCTEGLRFFEWLVERGVPANEGAALRRSFGECLERL
jgi:hypothetical protein